MSSTETVALEKRNGFSAVSQEVEAFELAQRQAKALMTSDLIPQQYRNNLGNVLIALNMAKRLGADPLMTMQNLYIVHGHPGWSAVFLIATFNQNGKFSAIKYRFDGEGDDYGCTAYATELKTGEVIEGSKVTWAVVKGEGWSMKQGSKWKTMPDQMFRYRAATFFIRATAPEIAMGLQTKDELEDVGPDIQPQQMTEAAAGVAGLSARLGIPAATEPVAIEGEVEEPETLQETSDTNSAIDAKEQKRLDMITEIDELLATKTGGDVEEMKKILDGRDLTKLTTGQLKDFRQELAKK